MSDEKENLHECPNCGRKVPDWEWDEGEDMFDELRVLLLEEACGWVGFPRQFASKSMEQRPEITALLRGLEVL